MKTIDLSEIPKCKISNSNQKLPMEENNRKRKWQYSCKELEQYGIN